MVIVVILVMVVVMALVGAAPIVLELAVAMRAGLGVGMGIDGLVVFKMVGRRCRSLLLLEIACGVVSLRYWFLLSCCNRHFMPGWSLKSSLPGKRRLGE